MGETSGGQGILPPNIQVALLTSGGKPGDGHRLDQREGIFFHQQAILEGTWFRLVSIAHEVMRPHRSVCHRLPLSTRGKRSPAPPEQFGIVHLPNDRLWPQFDGSAQGGIAIVGTIGIEAGGINPSDSAQEAQVGIACLGN